MIVSDLNPFKFWIVPALTTSTDHSALILTHNTEEKNGASDIWKYFHKYVISDPETAIEFKPDDIEGTFFLRAYFEDNTFWMDFDFNFISGSSFRCLLNLAAYSATISGMKMWFAIVDDADHLLAITDHIRMETSSNRSKLIKYYNDSPYLDVLANSTMYLRVPAIFNKPFSPEETEADDLSDGTLVILSSNTKERMLFDLTAIPMPGYMHRKVSLILGLTSVYIKKENSLLAMWEEWKKEEPYKMNDYPSKKTELTTGSVLLTKQGSISHNVYSAT